MVLIGIVSRNRAALLPKAINSALVQINIEQQVAVFDNNSTDNTRSIEQQFPDVQWIFSDHNLGIIDPRNRFMSDTQATYFCSLDDDAWFLGREELSLAIGHLDRDPDIAAIAFDILSPDKPAKSHVSQPVETNVFVGCGHVLRLSAVREVGFYKPSPGFYGGEEKDLCIRLIDRGYKIVKLQGVHVWHDKTPLSRNIDIQHQSGVCNDLVFAYRRTPSLYLIPALCIKIIKNLRFAIIYKKQNLKLATFRGIRDFLKAIAIQAIEREPVTTVGFKKYNSLKNV